MVLSALRSASPDLVAAQEIIGVVTVVGTDEPVSGALVSAVDLGGERSAQTLSSISGTFSLSLPPGEYRVLVERIGLQDWRSEPIVLAEGRVSLTVRVELQPIAMEPLQVDMARVCRLTAVEAAEGWQLYGRAIQALIPLVEREADSSYRYQVLVEESIPERPINASLEYLRLEPAPADTVTLGQPVYTASSEVLTEAGYIHAAPDAGLRFYMPTATVFSSPGFRDSHCFSVAESNDSDRLGLRFEPVPGRSLPDVEGVFWLDSSSHPVELAFRFTSVVDMLREHQMPPILAHVHADLQRDPRVEEYRLDLGSIVSRAEFGGQLRFEQLGNGQWITRSWELVVPILALQGGGLFWQERPAVFKARPTAFPLERRGRVLVVAVER